MTALSMRFTRDTETGNTRQGGLNFLASASKSESSTPVYCTISLRDCGETLFLWSLSNLWSYSRGIEVLSYIHVSHGLL